MDLKHFAEVVMRSVREYVQPAVDQLVARDDAIEKRIAALEAQQEKTLADSYEGAHLQGKRYARGKLVTHAGSLWLALAETSDKPGESGAWKMVVARGRDAR